MNKQLLLNLVIKYAKEVLEDQSRFGYPLNFTCNVVRDNAIEELMDGTDLSTPDLSEYYRVIDKVFEEAQVVFVNAYCDRKFNGSAFINTMIDIQAFPEQQHENWKQKWKPSELFTKYRVIWLNTLIDYCTKMLEKDQ